MRHDTTTTKHRLKGPNSAKSALSNAHACLHRGDEDRTRHWIERSEERINDAYQQQAEIVEELESQLVDVLDDNRHHYASANVQTNGALALIQTRLRVKRQMLEWFLELLEGEDYELDHDPDVPERVLEDDDI